LNNGWLFNLRRRSPARGNKAFPDGLATEAVLAALA